METYNAGGPFTRQFKQLTDDLERIRANLMPTIKTLRDQGVDAEKIVAERIEQHVESFANPREREFMRRVLRDLFTPCLAP